MNRQLLARAGSLALIVLSTTSTASECERRNAEYSGSSSSRSAYQVDVRAGDHVCWRLSMDGRDSSGCGDATFYGHRSTHEARLEKTQGDGSVRVTLRSGSRTRDRATVHDDGEHAHVRDSDQRSGQNSDWRDHNGSNDDKDWRDHSV
jgi:hypothetical protein